MNNLKEVFCTKIPPPLVNFREVVFEDDYSFTDSVRSKEKVDIETEAVLSRYGSKTVYPTLKNLNVIEINYSVKREGKEIKTGGSFEIGPVSSPLDPKPILRKCYSFNGETFFHNDISEDTIFHRTLSSYN